MAAKKSDTTTKIAELLTLEQVKAQLLETGKKNGHLSHEEIADKLQNFEMDSDQMDEFFEAIAENDITLINEKMQMIQMIRSILMIYLHLQVLKLTILFVCI